MNLNQKNDSIKFDINDGFNKMIDFFHKNGYIIIENAISDDILKKLKNDLYSVEYNEKKNNSDKKNTKNHTMHKCFFEKSEEMIKFISNSKLVDFVQCLIADVPGGRGNTLTAHLIHNNAFIIPPGGRGQAPSWHTDDSLQNIILPEGMKLPNSVKLPVLVATCMLWLSDCNLTENGPTYIVPESHRFGKLVDPEYADKYGIPACGKAGTAVVINSQVWHRGCENKSNISRETIQISFGRRIIGHKFKSIMDYKMPQNVTKNMNSKSKERFGYLQGGAYS